MKLQRFSLVDTEDWIFDGENEYPVTTQAIGPVDDGEYYRAADVDALLARIRAVGGEMIRHAEMYRAASCYAYAGRDNPALIADRERQERGYHATVAALDARLADGDA